MKRLWLLLLISFMLPLSAKVVQSLSGADSLSIGSSFGLKIETDFALRELSIPDTLKQFRVLDVDVQTTPEGSSAFLKIVVLQTGALSFPKLDLLPLEEGLEAQSTDAFRVHVLATRAEADTLLRDIKAPVRYPWELPFWVYLLLALICLGLAIYLLVKAMQKPKPAKAIPLPKPQPVSAPIPPWKKALAALAILRESGLAERDHLAYHYQLSAILRTYLEERYQFNALEMTNSEIRQTMKRHQEAHSPEALAILEYCDIVKFAKWPATPEQISMHTMALQLYLAQQGGLSGL